MSGKIPGLYLAAPVPSSVSLGIQSNSWIRTLSSLFAGGDTNKGNGVCDQLPDDLLPQRKGTEVESALVSSELHQPA